MCSHKDEDPKCFTFVALVLFLQIQKGLLWNYCKCINSTKAGGPTQTKGLNVQSSNIYTDINPSASSWIQF